MSILPLVLMWMWSESRRGGGTPNAPAPPQWPTAASPPPPMPAFAAQATPTAEHGTPLQELHKAPPAPAPAHQVPKPKPKQSAASQALQAARSGRIPGVKLPGGLRLPGFGLSTTPSKVALVFDLQGILNTHGATLARDGLYGPKTASAWQALAKKNGLPTTISRNGPKTARVAVQTFDALNVPSIP